MNTFRTSSRTRLQSKHPLGPTLAVLAVGGSMLAAAGAQASIALNPVQAGGQLSLNSGGVVTPSPGNDNVPGLSPNTISWDVDCFGLYGGTTSFNGGTGPATEYTATIVVENNTGVTWNGYTMSLEAGSRAAPVLQSTYIFDFDLSPTLTGSPGNWTSPNNNRIEWTGLNVPSGSSITLVANVDFPVTGAGGWWIDQWPTQVPSPGPGVLALAGTLLAIRRRR